MATSDSKAPIRTVKRVQFGILAPDEIVSAIFVFTTFIDNLLKFLMKLKFMFSKCKAIRQNTIGMCS